ncbi:hypothetical protein F2Q68_00014728 [Brassica cretica]|uniref:Reverse transcriptase zinc-binding domain-containing protein n=1 Tax=Brassica cretica TaxID=69181 RepID=A0A8S9HC79_BRACR|nr:hypothetical protein F2Q68_00014728 [Brassica cretica]
MTTLPTWKSSRPLRLLTLLAWQSTTYWIWNERNARLHSNTFRSIDILSSASLISNFGTKLKASENQIPNSLPVMDLSCLKVSITSSL